MSARPAAAHDGRRRPARLTVVGVAVLAVATAAAAALNLLARQDGASEPPPFSFSLRVIDESGAPLGGAVLSSGGRKWRTDASGTAQISTRGVLAGPLRATGFLAEPLVVGRSSDGRVVSVRLWASRGGRRFSYHAAGDVMLGRRYLHPRPGATTARLDPGRLDQSARAVVSQVAPVFGAATFATVNLETAVGRLPASQAAPGKDLVIQTPPGALGALEELGVDAALGANNHVRDYGDQGVATTRLAVEELGIAYGGAGRDDRQAARPVRLSRHGSGLVVLSFCGLNGDGMNRAYAAARPALGAEWRRFRRLERSDPAAARRAWPALISAHPKLQDWVARRGHGGANAWDSQRSAAAIRRAARGRSPVVVQLQRGFQYASVPPVGMIEAAHTAIDAGADIVIAHHPHVLQGFEWYRGRLIAYSLGNFVFDQDLLATYPGGFLRTVWEGDRLLEARFVPTVLVGYRPLPVAGATADRILRRLAAASVLPARASRRGGEGTRLVPRRLPRRSLVGAHVERNTLVLESHKRRHVAVARTLRPGERRRLSRDRLYVWGDRVAPAGVLAGRDVFGFGSFDDEAAGASGGVLQWRFGRATSWEQADGSGYLVIRRTHDSRRTARARPVSRIPIAEPSLALDGAVRHELRFRARLQGGSRAWVRLHFYRFDAGGLSVETASRVVGRRTVRLEVARDGGWHDMSVALDPPRSADYVLPTFLLEPAGHDAALALDDVAVIEWRRALGPAYPQALEYVRNATARPKDLRLAATPLEAGR
jgi:poly-gamma-glutamate capsule biosynthesis protein CapA/YwtB (metallophosphatase superfamily)